MLLHSLKNYFLKFCMHGKLKHQHRNDWSIARTRCQLVVCKKMHANFSRYNSSIQMEASYSDVISFIFSDSDGKG